MLKSIEDITTTKKRLRIEIPAEVVEREVGVSLEGLRQKVKLPGFRPGKAPLNLLEKRYGKEIEAEVLEKVVPQHYDMALREADLHPVAMPELEEKFDFKRNNPLNLTFVIEIVPKIENLAYEQIRVRDYPVALEESDVETTLKRLQEQKAVLEVSDEPVGMDDLVSFDYIDSQIVDGENFPSLKDTISAMGNEVLPSDIMERALGKKKDDLIEFTKTFDQSEKAKDLIGKTVKITISVKEIKKKSIPQMDDELAKDLGFESLAELREKLKEKILAAKKDHVQKLQKSEIIRKLVESASPEVPDSMIDNEIQSLAMANAASGSREESVPTDTTSDVIETAAESAQEGEKDLDRIKVQKEIEDEQKKLRQKALFNVQASVLIDSIGKKEGIIVTD
ncbi:MAG TPA: trigger factor, partial [Thermodesulfovibrionales bacterium]|nr:trigger factor [Thermodesulfovibrionales bacterium]